jgi:hypothetical protein
MRKLWLILLAVFVGVLALAPDFGEKRISSGWRYQAEEWAARTELVFGDKLRAFTGGAPTLTIHFDDSEEELYDNLFPLVKKYWMPVSLPINTDALDSATYLTTLEAVEMASTGLVELLDHSATHSNWTTSTDADIDSWITDSFNWWMTNLGFEPKTLVWTGGQTDQHTQGIGRSRYKWARGVIGFEEFPGDFNNFEGACAGIDVTTAAEIQVLIEKILFPNSQNFGCVIAHRVEENCASQCLETSEVEALFVWINGQRSRGRLSVLNYSDYAAARQIWRPAGNLVRNPRFKSYVSEAQYPRPSPWTAQDAAGSETLDYDFTTEEAVLVHTAAAAGAINSTNHAPGGLVPGWRYQASVRVDIPTLWTGTSPGCFLQILDTNSDSACLSDVESTAAVHYLECEFVADTDATQLYLYARGSNGTCRFSKPSLQLANRGTRTLAGGGDHEFLRWYSNTFHKTTTLDRTGIGTQSIDLSVMRPATEGTHSAGNRFKIHRVTASTCGSTDFDLAFHSVTAGGGTKFKEWTALNASVSSYDVFYVEDADYPTDSDSNELHIFATNNDGGNDLSCSLSVDGVILGLTDP